MQSSILNLPLPMLSKLAMVIATANLLSIGKLRIDDCVYSQLTVSNLRIVAIKPQCSLNPCKTAGSSLIKKLHTKVNGKSFIPFYRSSCWPCVFTNNVERRSYFSALFCIKECRRWLELEPWRAAHGSRSHDVLHMAPTRGEDGGERREDVHVPWKRSKIFLLE